MTQSESTQYKTSHLFGKSEENLSQIPARFKSSTLEDIELIAEANGVSKAEVIRKLVDLGLQEVIN